ncbi:unnamed protein product [Plutella xylostella]|uniref:(diamondback moth) hypothetical protein n=1 Tax=Plutella xylostella TaxID=51655 RepID=A0A8S4DKM0_PLUXY|nr:unnamed protein product [Plutella xylostella]
MDGDNFVHRLVQNKSDGKLVPVEEDAPPPDKQLEFTYILTSQLDTQRAHYDHNIAHGQVGRQAGHVAVACAWRVARLRGVDSNTELDTQRAHYEPQHSPVSPPRVTYILTQAARVHLHTHLAARHAARALRPQHSPLDTQRAHYEPQHSPVSPPRVTYILTQAARVHLHTHLAARHAARALRPQHSPLDTQRAHYEPQHSPVSPPRVTYILTQAARVHLHTHLAARHAARALRPQHSPQLEFTYILTSQLDTQRAHYDHNIAQLKEAHSAEVTALTSRAAAAEARADSLQLTVDKLTRENKVLEKKLNTVTNKLSSLSGELNEERGLAAAMAKSQAEWQAKAKQDQDGFVQQVTDDEQSIRVLRALAYI